MGSRSPERRSFYVGVKGIIRRGESILILRDAGRQKWELPGGRLDQGQDMNEAFSREIAEEIENAAAEELGDTVHVAIGDFTVENDHSLILVFREAKVTLPTDIKLSDEHDDSKWISALELDDLDIYSTDKEALQRAFTR